jgi:type IX secretion system PorP/SprF family membrane protein
MKRGIVLLFGLFISFCSFGQVVNFTQYLPNPYLINPAYAGYEGRSTFALTHRRQWIGIDEAPVSTNFNYHVPFLSGVNLGVNITQDEGGIFKSTSGLVTGGYTLSLGWYHFLSVGLSIGAGNTGLDLDEDVNLNDPALGGVLDNGSYLLGNFGIAYHLHGLNLGATLPDLFTTQTYYRDSTEGFYRGDFDALQNFIVNLDYMLYFGGGAHAFQPYAIYRSYPEYSPQFDVGGVFHINHLLWIGGAYKGDFGYSGYLGFKISDLTFGYAYDMSSQSVSGVNLSTHEIQLTYTIGLKSSWADQYSTFLSSQKPSRPERQAPPTREDNPRFNRGQRY